MFKLICFLMLMLTTVPTLAQDWRDIDNNGTGFDCDVVDAIVADFGDEPVIRRSERSFVSVAELLDAFFPSCEHEPIDDISEYSASFDTLLAGVMAPDDGTAVTALLPPDLRYSIDEKDCSVIISDDLVGDFNLSISGHRQDQMTIDVYFPDETEPAAMDHVHNYTVNVGGLRPVRTEWVSGTSFPTGWYTFDVQIEDATFRFQWLRHDQTYNTFELTCLFAPETTDGEFMYRLSDGASLELANSSCSVFSISWETDFRVIAGGPRYRDILVDVTFPGTDNPAEFDNSDVTELDSGTPFRLDVIAGDDFPLGNYQLDVTIADQTYQVTWDRQDPQYNTVGASCIVNG